VARNPKASKIVKDILYARRQKRGQNEKTLEGAEKKIYPPQDVRDQTRKGFGDLKMPQNQIETGNVEQERTNKPVCGGGRHQETKGNRNQKRAINLREGVCGRSGNNNLQRGMTEEKDC